MQAAQAKKEIDGKIMKSHQSQHMIQEVFEEIKSMYCIWMDVYVNKEGIFISTENWCFNAFKIK